MTTLSIGSICIHVCDQESLCKSAIKSVCVCVVYMLSKMSVKMCMVNIKCVNVCQETVYPMSTYPLWMRDCREYCRSVRDTPCGGVFLVL